MAVDLRIPKREVVVDFRWMESPTECSGAHLFLNLSSPVHSGPQTVEEFLAEGLRFVPVRLAGGQSILLNLDRVVWIREPGEEVPAGGNPLSLILSDGAVLTVNFLGELPMFHARPVDYFNSASPFLCFFQQGRRIHVHRHWIFRVEGI
jgi:hypothetical protein